MNELVFHYYKIFFDQCPLWATVGVKCQSLCGYEVTWKIKQLEVEGGTCPSAP